MTHGPECIELYEARIVRLTDEQAAALSRSGAVLMPWSEQSLVG